MELPAAPKRFALAIALVLLAAFALRAYAIEDDPPGFVDDEVAGAVAAWSVATTGHDVTTTWLPFLYVVPDSMKMPLYFAATVPLQAVLGRRALALRLPAVLFGTLSAGLVILLARLLRRSRAEAIVAGTLFAVTPWAVHYGRVGWEPAALLPFTLSGLALLWTGLDRHLGRSIAAGVIVLALGAYAYSAALFLHVTLGALVLAVRAPDLTTRDLRTVTTASIGGLLVLGPYVKALLSEPFMTERLRSIWVFRNGYDLAALGHVLDNAGKQWDLDLFFLEGHWNLHYGPGMPILLWPFALLVPAGLVALAFQRDRVAAMLVAWLVLGQLPGILTDYPPNWSRGLVVVPALCLVAAIGALALGRWVRPNPLRIGLTSAVVAATVLQATLLYRLYFFEYPDRAHWFFRTGLGDTVRVAALRAGPSDTVCVRDVQQDVWGFDYYVRFALGGPAPFMISGSARPSDCDYVLTYADRAERLRPQDVIRVSAGSPYVLARLR